MSEPTQLAYEGVIMPEGAPHHRMLETDRCARALGIEVLQADPGHARLSMTVRRDMTNGFDIVHGGMIFSLADTAFAMACNHPTDDEGTITVATGVDINFLASAHVGDELVAEAVEVSRTGRSGIADVTISRGDQVIGVFRGRSRTIPSPENRSPRKS